MPDSIVPTLIAPLGTLTGIALTIVTFAETLAAGKAPNAFTRKLVIRRVEEKLPPLVASGTPEALRERTGAQSFEDAFVALTGGGEPA